MKNMKKITFSTTDGKYELKNELAQAIINVNSCINFVARQELNDKTHYEFKKLNVVCDKLDNIWGYLDTCIHNELPVEILDITCYIITSLSILDVDEYKSYYSKHGEFMHNIFLL